MARLMRPIRQLSPQLHYHYCNQATTQQLISPKLRLPLPAPSLSTVLFPSYSTTSSPPRRRVNIRKRRPAPPEALVPAVTQEEEADGEGVESDADKSRNQRKREARRAVRWGRELASFSSDQIKRILRAASLDEDVYDALMLAKRLGPDVREGKRRQFSFVGKLLREVEPELMDTLIQATKQGDQRTLHLLVSSAKKLADDVGDGNDDVKTESKVDVQEPEEEHISVATRWLDGLIGQDVHITKEVYSLQSIDFDRQELRKLVRKVHSAKEQWKTRSPETEKSINASVLAAEKSLTRFLRSLAKQVESIQNESDL